MFVLLTRNSNTRLSINVYRISIQEEALEKKNMIYLFWYETIHKIERVMPDLRGL